MSRNASTVSPLLISPTPVNAASHQDLVTQARTCLAQAPLSVIDKEKTPPSGDKRDWMNLADYMWPNPDTPDGLPYVGRDGHANPEAAQYDRRRYNCLVVTVLRLGAAWQVTGESVFAEKAAALLTHWFIDPVTGMRPNLNFCHFTPGQARGRLDGMIVLCSSLPSLLDVWRLLCDAGYIEAAQDAAMQAWATEFIDWMRRDPISIDHVRLENNHGSFHDLLEVYLMRFVGQDDAAREYLARMLPVRLAAQINADGEMPRETKRSLSAQYSLYNLKALYGLAHMADSIGVDGWARQEKSPPLLRATDYLYRHATGAPAWPFQQIEPANWWYLAPLCRVANHIYQRGYDLEKIPLTTTPDAVPRDLVVFVPGWELLFAPSHQQHMPAS